ncbi:DRMBL-domain-containing protein [Mucor ambiguus]|uniref:DRMBL-domain-containing protein n=1 Tax=Mucor ambiguus TaxID=91626 RepID=A0A0C9MS62_9FUNG|nr:DRMBL-domain-containing protein [Mucor ambiguus]
MAKQPTQENDTSSVKSKYFSIETYFKTPANVNKRLKPSTSDLQVEKAIRQQEEKKERCPLCQLWILTESISMEVHVNQCLDMEQEREKENIPPLFMSFSEEVSCSSSDNNSTRKDGSFSVEATIESRQEKAEEEKDTVTSFIDSSSIGSSLLDDYESIKHVAKCDTKITNTISVQPSSWRTMFSSTSSTASVTTAKILGAKDVNVSLPSTTTLSPQKKKQKPCPFYKRIRDTRFTVDAFNYGKITDCDGYFLTHYHADHYGGLRANWSHGPIYCSQVTANLVKQELRVDSRYVHPLPMDQLYTIPGSNVQVALIDANHCPGSVLFLFVVDKKRHLHTGDFRAAPRMCLHPLIKQPENPPISCVYLDTTYLSPQYAFPAQEECIQAVCNVVKKELAPKIKKPSFLESWISIKRPVLKEEQPNDPMTTTDAFKLMMNQNNKATASRVLIVVGTYTIGKERVFINIARMLKCKIYAPYKKKRILLCQEDDELKSMLTNNPSEAQVHVVPLRDIRADIMSNYLKEHQAHFTSLIGFKPTGWTFKSTSSQTSDMKLAPLSEIIIPPADRTVQIEPYYNRNDIKLYGVPYSEHSSFRELASFIASMSISHIIPTVNVSQMQAMSVYFDRWQEEKMAKRVTVVKYPNQEYW